MEAPNQIFAHACACVSSSSQRIRSGVRTPRATSRNARSLQSETIRRWFGKHGNVKNSCLSPLATAIVWQRSQQDTLHARHAHLARLH
jgi:hypothetical protein